MFNESPDVFSNVSAEHRPDFSPTQGMGRSPDGIGAPPAPPRGAALAPSGVGYTAPWEPQDVSPEAAVRAAGITTLAAALGFGVGLAAGGWKGGIAGILLTGGLFNGYRAQKWWSSPDPGEKNEAVVSAIMGTVGVVAGGYAAYKTYEAKKKGE